MPKYLICLTETDTRSAELYVEAASREEAVKAAEEAVRQWTSEQWTEESEGTNFDRDVRILSTLSPEFKLPEGQELYQA